MLNHHRLSFAGHAPSYPNKLQARAELARHDHKGVADRSQRRGRSTMDEAVNLRFVAGDPQAMRHICATHGRALYGVAYRVLGDSALAEEAVQQGLLQAWKAAATFDATRNIAPWLVTITKRAAIDLYRRERRHRAEELGDYDAPTPAESIEDVWEVYRVRMAVEQLTPAERQVLMLTHFSGMTHEAAAEHLQIPVGTVKSRSYRAYRKLSELLSDLEGAL